MVVMRRGLVAGTALGAVLLALTSPAFADHAEAVRLFDEGRKQRDAGQYHQAVQTFEKSIAQEASVGAYYNLGLCYEQLGRYREALDQFAFAKDLAQKKGDDRQKDAEAGMAKVREGHNWIELSVPDDIKNAPGLVITIDGARVPTSEFNGLVFRNKSSAHDVVVKANGRKDVFTQVANKGFARIALGENDATPPPPPPPLVTGGHGVAPPPSTPTEGGGWTQKHTGVTLIAAGVVAGAVGVVFGVKWLSDRSTFKSDFVDACAKDELTSTPCRKNGNTMTPGKNGAQVQSASEASDTRASILVPTFLVAGGALIGLGIYYFATAKSTSKESASSLHVLPGAGPTGGGMSFVGAF